MFVVSLTATDARLDRSNQDQPRNGPEIEKRFAPGPVMESTPVADAVPDEEALYTAYANPPTVSTRTWDTVVVTVSWDVSLDQSTEPPRIVVSWVQASPINHGSRSIGGVARGCCAGGAGSAVAGGGARERKTVK